ncbi:MULTISPECIES: TetR/AcrR family transcriptional regulator [Kitasatospora]|uniref:TetR/AcrR family transcriptional regulator n=1 Tax=Kitasatospora TaxID=2063 RepID=UPI0031DDC453
MTTTPPAPRSRADAVRNQQLLVAAAARAFAKSGLGIPVSQIVRDAGLGKGTAFRCFPSKDHLVAEIVRERLDELTTRAVELAAEEDAGAALYAFLRAAAARYADDRGFFEALSLPPRAHPEVRASEERLIDAVDRLVHRAQRQGSVREDVTTVDVLLLLGGVRQAAAPLHPARPDLWQRYLDLVFDGLRAGQGRPPAGPAPTRTDYRRAAESLASGG